MWDEEAKAVQESAKAIQETAKMTGKIVGAAEKLGGFFGPYIAAPLTQISGMLSDQLEFTRWSRLVRLYEKADRILQERGLDAPTRNIPIQIAIPLIYEASLEEDDELQDMWALILVNAADESCDVQIRRAYVSILEDLTSIDLMILKTIWNSEYTNASDEFFDDGYYIGYLPNEAKPLDRYPPPKTYPVPSKEVFISVSNLLRLNLVRSTDPADGEPRDVHIDLTYFGKEFIRLCTFKGQ